VSREGGAFTPPTAVQPFAAPAAPGRPVLRWASRTRSIDGVATELSKIWSAISLTTPGDEGDPERRVAARSTVMNLVVIAGRGETGERAAAIIDGLTGRHPSRTLIVSPADPDGPSWIDAQVQAHCMLPSDTAPETCSELVYLTCGGESGQHMAGIVAPLLVHDLPVTLWWPGEPHFESKSVRDWLTMADRVIVDGAGWSGDGLAGLVAMAALPGRYQVEISDFALLRQARWREALASTFDRPALMPFLQHLDRVAIRYAAADGTPSGTNIVRPIYHAAWLASRLGMAVVSPIQASTEPWGGYDALLRLGRRRVPLTLRPEQSTSPRGTTLAVDLHARRNRADLAVDVTAYADGVVVKAAVDDDSMPERRFVAPRKREADLLAETIDTAGRDHVAGEVLAMAAELIQP
jgi:glucose-6-phosphate dehydrogenase assembly protein OpcA